MPRRAVSEPLGAPTRDDTDIPGLRTLRSAGFRSILACTLLIVGLVVVGGLLFRQASASDGQFAIDFGSYFHAAERWSAGESVYPPAMLEGPVAAQGISPYRYLPVFAQVLAPISGWGFDRVALLWLAVQAAAMLAALWVGTGIGGARRSVERALWCGVAAVYFLPVFDSLWKGNVGGLLALSVVLVARGGAVAGIAAAGGALLKSVPATLLPAALVMDSRSRWATILTLVIVGGLSFLLAPAAWFDYPTVLRNMLAGSADYANNLAPATVVGHLFVTGADDSVASTPAPGQLLAAVLRVGSVCLGVAALAASVWLARRRDGVPAAAFLGVIALLIIPASIWYHYFALLLPFAAIAWPRASLAQRGLLFGAAALITVGLAWLPLASAAAVLLAAATLYLLWPQPLRAPVLMINAPDDGVITNG